MVRPFWWTSDYGRSTARILLLFLTLATAFALAYCTWGVASPPGIVHRLFENENEAFLVDHHLVMLRSFYFSVVTMTTLGFGDMHAFAGSYWGHVLLTCQVLLGYFFLGALVTRLAILFQAGGPSDSFATAPRRTRIRRWVIAGVVAVVIAFALHQWYTRAVANWPSAQQHETAKQELMSRSTAGDVSLPEN